MKRYLLSCALILSLTSLGRAQQPPPNSDSKADASAPKAKRKLDADLSGFDVSGDKKVATILGASRGTAVPSATLLAPRRGKFYGASALFSWAFTGRNEGYTIIVTDEDETQLVHQQVKEPRYLLDSSKAKLQPGETYYWRVQVLPNPLASDPLEFVVVSAEERAAIDKAVAAIPSSDAYQSALARAHIFTDHRLWFDALGAYDELIAKFPNRSELYEERGAIYAQVAATKPLADADLARAGQAKK
jgi:hypothetical protein